MQKLSYSFIAFVTSFLIVSSNIVQAQTAVDQWGSIGRHGWPIIPNAVAGNAGMGGTGTTPAGAWATLRGGFGPLTATPTVAVIVTGKIEFVGGGPTSWSALRYGVFRHDSAGTLQNAGTDTARWSGLENNAYGYMFSPHSGTNDQVSGNGGNGTQWSVNGGSWLSTFSGGTYPMGVIDQAPARAEMSAGIYDWAFSIRPLGDGTNEIRWYIKKADNSYWFGGIEIDTSSVASDTYNGVVFGINPGNDIGTTGITGVSLTEVLVSTGNPIDVPEAPFEPFYIEDWGSINRHGWPIIPGDVIGNSGMGGTGTTPSGAWATLRGGFVVPVKATETKAVVVTGKIEFVGGGPTSWSALRYGVFRHDSVGTLQYADTDTARWGSIQYAGTDSARFVNGLENNAYGYMFSPHSGTNDQVSGNGGNGTQWSVNGGSWLSTFSGGTYPMGVIDQAPARAEMGAGMYDWAFSIRPLGDGTNEIRWYIKKADNSYWFGGIEIDTSSVASDTYNGVVFGINPGNDIGTTGITGVNLTDVLVDLGDPIEVPEAPFEQFYIEDWGSINRHGWPIIPGDVIGNAGMGGTGTTPSGAWATLRGGFVVPVKATETKAVVVTGKIEFVGGGPTSWSALRYGVFRHDSVGTLQYADTDTARWGSIQYAGTDSARFVNGLENNAYGYMFSPHSGTNDQVSGNGGNGTQWSVNGGSWLSTFSGGTYPMGVVNQAPARAEMGAGMYNWAFSIRPLGDGTNEIRWYIKKADNSYWFGGIEIDTSSVASDTYNGVVFGINPGNDIGTTGITGINLTDVLVDLGDPIIVPVKPWEDYYVDTWGFVNGKMGGWTITRGPVIGNVSISGSSPNTGWSAVRGAFFETHTLPENQALIVTGKMQFEGGGFEAPGSLRYGIFYSDSAGSVVVDTSASNGDSTYWSGSENYHSGYLFLPQSGSNGPVNWSGISQTGTWGAVVNDIWSSTGGANNYVLGSELQLPANAVGGAGEYNFVISVAPQGNGTTKVTFNLIKGDNSYRWAGEKIDNHNPLATDKFNSFAFALNSGNTTTALKLVDVKVSQGQPITGIDEADGLIPNQYSLSQNYPNPFNPATTIVFALPKNSDVSLVVYDILGKVVKELASGNFNAGYHTIDFNATNLASGVYFYSLRAGDYSSVKKLMLLK